MNPNMAAAAAESVGKIVQGFGTWQMKRAQAAQLKASAKTARVEASQDAQLRADEAERTAARAAVIGAATGGGFGGSFAGSFEQLERAGRFNVRSAIWAGESQAKALEYEAKVAKREGAMALFSAYIGAGGSLAGERMREAENRKQQAARVDLYRKGAS